MTNEINNLEMVEPSPELTINTEKKQTKSILSPALRAANALNKMKDIGKKFIELPISKDKLTVGAISSLNELEARTIVGNVRTYNTMNIKLFYNGNSANAKNIVSVLMLHANQDAEVVFLINGPDEEEAYKQLQEFCETNL